jgi:hypothetical protein
LGVVHLVLSYAFEERVRGVRHVTVVTPGAGRLRSVVGVSGSRIPRSGVTSEARLVPVLPSPSWCPGPGIRASRHERHDIPAGSTRFHDPLYCARNRIMPSFQKSQQPDAGSDAGSRLRVEARRADDRASPEVAPGR